MTPTIRNIAHPKTNIVTVRLSDDMLKDMCALHTRDGIPLSEQIRRALRPWLKAQQTTRTKKGGTG